MSEINNNVNNIRFHKNNFDKNINEPKKNPAESTAEEKPQAKIVPDTGVLGRSQIQGVKGGDIAKSIDEAVALAQEYPEVLETGDSVFDSLYNDFIKAGKSPEEAYAMASTGMMEFMEIAKPYCRKN